MASLAPRVGVGQAISRTAMVSGNLSYLIVPFLNDAWPEKQIAPGLKPLSENAKWFEWVGGDTRLEHVRYLTLNGPSRIRPHHSRHLRGLIQQSGNRTQNHTYSHCSLGAIVHKIEEHL